MNTNMKSEANQNLDRSANLYHSFLSQYFRYYIFHIFYFSVTMSDRALGVTFRRKLFLFPYMTCSVQPFREIAIFPYRVHLLRHEPKITFLNCFTNDSVLNFQGTGRICQHFPFLANHVDLLLDWDISAKSNPWYEFSTKKGPDALCQYILFLP